MNELDFSTKVENSQKYVIFEKKIPLKIGIFWPFSPTLYKTFFFSADFGRFFYSSENYLFLDELSVNELDFLQKSQNCHFKPNFDKKNTCFFSIFSVFLPILEYFVQNLFFVGRFWPIYVFLQEMCYIRLFIDKWTRFLSKKSKLPQKATFYSKKKQRLFSVFCWILIAISFQKA